MNKFCKTINQCNQIVCIFDAQRCVVHVTKQKSDLCDLTFLPIFRNFNSKKMHLTKPLVVKEKKSSQARANILCQGKMSNWFSQKKVLRIIFLQSISNFFYLRNFLSYACSKKQISVSDEKFAINQAQSHTQQFPCDRPNKINNPPVLL